VISRNVARGARFRFKALVNENHLAKNPAMGGRPARFIIIINMMIFLVWEVAGMFIERAFFSFRILKMNRREAQ